MYTAANPTPKSQFLLDASDLELLLQNPAFSRISQLREPTNILYPPAPIVLIYLPATLLRARSLQFEIHSTACYYI